MVLFGGLRAGKGERQQQECGEQSAAFHRHNFFLPARDLLLLAYQVRRSLNIPQKRGCPAQGRATGEIDASRNRSYLIFDSLYSTCFLAIGSYFFLTSLSVCVREFFLVT